MQLRRVAQVNPPVPELRGLGDDEVTFLPLEAVWPDGRRRYEFTKPANTAGYTVLRRGDVVMPKITPTFEAGRVFVADDLPTSAGLATTEVHVLRPRGIEPRYLSYFLRTQPVLSEGETVLQGVGNLRRVTPEWVESLVVPVVDRGEQRRIADYLDRETATIDALIEKQRALISGLRERRSAAVEHAVSGFTTSADETFVEGPSWMGSIPSTWRTFPLWAMYRREKRTGFIEEPMVSVFRDFGVVFKADRANLNETAEDRSIYQLVEPGWFVVNRMKAWQGSVGVSSIRGISSGHYLCFRPLHGENHKFLNWLFRSPQYRHGFAMLSRGVRPGQAEIDNDQLRKMPVVLPPLDEQREIADHLDRETATIDALIAKAERFIELAQERRAALITAAVTGQIEIPTED
ncbi:restriction endonuclease subunit S [Kaistella montana]|nr:restriction endonuclease subunit S [Kaistella montana]